MMAQHPSSFGEWLNAGSFILGKPREIALIGSDEEIIPLLQVVRTSYRPFQVVAAGKETDDNTIGLLAHRSQLNNKAAAYVCRRFLCQAPVTEPEQLASQLGD
jgi:uncharacterized protein YyaL (SSP411 family)